MIGWLSGEHTVQMALNYEALTSIVTNTSSVNISRNQFMVSSGFAE